MSKPIALLFVLPLVFQFLGCSDGADDAAPKQESLYAAAPTGLVPGMKMRPGVEESCLPKAQATDTPGGGPAKRAPGYTPVDTVTDGGSISGTVSYAGSDTDALLDITSDNTVCEDPATPGKRKAGALLVANGKLQNAVVMLDGIKSGKGFEAQSVTIDNLNCMFSPRVALMRKGDEMAALNSDTVLHNTHLFLKKGDKKRELENIALSSKGTLVKKKIKKTGLVDVKCDAHRWMQGWIYVTDHPYAVLTDANGGFKLEDVPPGEYTLKVWHEKLPAQKASVTVTASGAVTQDFTIQ